MPAPAKSVTPPKASGRSKPRPRYDVTVRAARRTDLDALVRGTLGNALDSEGIRLDEAKVRRGVGALLQDPHKGRVFVAEQDGTVVGSTYVTFEWSDWHDAWYWWIQSVYVPPGHRRKGVYSALHAAVLAAAKTEGNVRSVRLYVEAHNTPALAAYSRLGMVHTPYQVFEAVVRG